MSKNQDENHIQYCNSNSVVVINPVGKLKQVFTPFRVSQKAEDGKTRWFLVDEVRSTAEDKLVYLIGGKPYYHNLFVIDVHF